MPKYPLFISSETWSSLWLLLLFVFACTPPQEATTDIRSDLEARWDQFIAHWEKEDTDQLVAMYTAEAINVPPALPENQGREQIADFYNFLFANNLSSTYRHQIESVQYEGGMAIEYGAFEVEWITNDSTESLFRARSVTHWVQSEEGEWQIQLFLFNQPPTKNSEGAQ